MGIVLLPSSGKQSVKRFEDTILHGIPKETVIKNTHSPAVLEAVNNVPGDNIAVWGFVEKTTNHNATKWKKIRPGDTVVFYAKHRLNYTGTIVEKEDNVELSNILWGEESPGHTWNLIFYIDELVRLSGVEFKPSVLGYNDNYVLQAALVIEDGDRKYHGFVDYYGDLL
jgi:hypothetical protein